VVYVSQDEGYLDFFRGEDGAGAEAEAEADKKVPTRAPALASPSAKDCASLVVSVITKAEGVCCHLSPR
jgi:hypothetical protein